MVCKRRALESEFHRLLTYGKNILFLEFLYRTLCHAEHTNPSRFVPRESTPKSSPQSLHHIMNSINDHRENTPHTIHNQTLKMPHRLLLTHLQMEALPHLLHHPPRLDLDIGNIGIDHQAEQIEDEVRALAQRGVGREAVGFEGRVVRRGRRAHALDHLLAEFHLRREGLRVPAEDVAEVGVEEVPVGRQEEVVEVAVADAEEVGDDAVSGAGFDVGVHGGGADAQVGGRVGVVGAEVGEDAAFVFGGCGGEGH